MGDVECVWPAGAVLGEGPLWDERERAVYWVDIKQPAIHRFRPGDGDRTTWPMTERIGSIARRRGKPGFVAAFKSGFAFLDLETGAVAKIGDPEPNRPGNRFNDGKCDPAGRFWAGSMDDEESEAAGWLYRLDPDLNWTQTDGPYRVTNGPAFSPDGAIIYHTDSPGRTVYQLTVGADGSLSEKRVFVRFEDPAWGYPDGMTVDAEGCLWVAHWAGWRITRFTPAGAVERVIELPVAKVTSCAFGGPDLDTLYITSASIDLDEAERRDQPLAGGLFALRTDVAGLPAARFAG